LAGKKDPFAAAEERARKRGGGGGGGGGSGGGGGGGGGSGGFNFSEWGDSFRKGTSSFFKTVATILLFGATLFALTLWRPLLAFLASLVSIMSCAASLSLRSYACWWIAANPSIISQLVAI
jgi:hypothetical protein